MCDRPLPGCSSRTSSHGPEEVRHATCGNADALDQALATWRLSQCLTSKRTRPSRYDWSRFSTAADLTCLKMCFIPSSAGAESQAFPPVDPEVGPGAQRKLYEMFYQAIPDARAEVLDVVAGGDKVVLVDRFGGTHRGEFLGRPGTGDRIEWMAIHIYTIRDGKVLEDAVMTDALAIMQQLGLAPSLTKAAE